MPSSTICVDANLVVRMLERNAEGQRILAIWRQWDAEGRTLVAPALIYFEITNALYRYVRKGQMTATEVTEALDVALNLHIDVHRGDDLHYHAMRIAGALGLPACYDAHYLALAERLGAELWTADQRLYNSVRRSLPWVHAVEEHHD